MEELIKQAFLHVEVIGPRVQEGQYDLVGPDGEIILPRVWETIVQPDWSISMMMWPMAEPEAKTVKGAADIVAIEDFVNVNVEPTHGHKGNKPIRHPKDKAKGKGHAAHPSIAPPMRGASAIPVPPNHTPPAAAATAADAIPIPPHHGSPPGGAGIADNPMIAIVNPGGNKPRKAPRPPSSMLGWFAGSSVRPNQSLKGPKNEVHRVQTIPTAVNGGNAHSSPTAAKAGQGQNQGGCVVM